MWLFVGSGVFALLCLLQKIGFQFDLEFFLMALLLSDVVRVGLEIAGAGNECAAALRLRRHSPQGLVCSWGVFGCLLL